MTKKFLITNKELTKTVKKEKKIYMKTIQGQGRNFKYLTNM